MRKLALGLVTVALIGAVGCGNNNEENNATNNTTSENNTTGSNNTATNNTATNNTATNNTATNNTATNNTSTNNTSTNNATNNSTTTNNATNNSTNNATNNATNNTTGPSAKCTQYCDLMDANCDATYADRAACETACAGLAEDATLDCATPGDCANATEGVECRIYHADVAAGGPNGDHCTHASEDGAGVCG